MELAMRYIPPVSRDTRHLLARVQKASRHHHTRQRAHCILLSLRGYSVTQLQDIFHVNRATIYNWFNAWDARKFAGLYDRSGRGANRKLNSGECMQVKVWGKQFPRQIKKIRALIADQFGKRVSTKTVRRILKGLKMSWRRVRRRVKGRPDVRDYAQKAQQLALLRQQHAQGALDLRYVDQSGFCLMPYLPYAWQEKGETIELPASYSRKRLNVVGFLNTENDFQAYTFDTNIDSEVMMACIDEFCKSVTKRTVLVLDQAPIHTSGVFRDRFAEWKAQGVEIFELPAYSPELNLIEILWRFIKYSWLDFEAYLSWNHLVSCVEDVLRQVGAKYTINFG